MCDISRVFNNILTMANDLVINLKSTGKPVGFRQHEFVKQFTENLHTFRKEKTFKVKYLTNQEIIIMKMST